MINTQVEFEVFCNSDGIRFWLKVGVVSSPPLLWQILKFFSEHYPQPESGFTDYLLPKAGAEIVLPPTYRDPLQMLLKGFGSLWHIWTTIYSEGELQSQQNEMDPLNSGKKTIVFGLLGGCIVRHAQGFGWTLGVEKMSFKFSKTVYLFQKLHIP